MGPAGFCPFPHSDLSPEPGCGPQTGLRRSKPEAPEPLASSEPAACPPLDEAWRCRPFLFLLGSGWGCFLVEGKRIPLASAWGQFWKGVLGTAAEAFPLEGLGAGPGKSGGG